MTAELLGVSERAVQAHYQRLIAAQLVYAKSYESETYEKGALPKAYGLTDSGVSVAFKEGFATDSTKTFKGHALSTIEHELMISKFHLELAKLAEQKGWDLRWRQRDLDKKDVRPDALFRINGNNFFLEIERARLGNYKDGRPGVIRKLDAYWKYYDSTGCEKNFTFRKFRVVTVMRTPARVRTLINALNNEGLDKATFWVSSEADFFAFSTPKSLVSFDSLMK
jgi:hypothetical protein